MKFLSPIKNVWWIQGKTPEYISEELEEFYQNALKGEYPKVNYKLAGVFEGEYYIKHSDTFNKFITDSIETYIDRINEVGNYWGLDSTSSVDIVEQWINLQGPRDWNPMHSHSYDYSYVFWHKVPFTFENEQVVNPKAKTSGNFNLGDFSFHYPDLEKGRKVGPSGLRTVINNTKLGIDNKGEGNFAIFPAWLQHSVEPFYSSDEFRVSFSGNLEQVKKESTLI